VEVELAGEMDEDEEGELEQENEDECEGEDGAGRAGGEHGIGVIGRGSDGGWGLG